MKMLNPNPEHAAFSEQISAPSKKLHKWTNFERFFFSKISIFSKYM